MAEEVILRFNEVTFEYLVKKPVLKDASFSVRRGAKITLMGQNGAGKSTIFSLIRGEVKPKSGQISTTNNPSIGSARQTMAREHLSLSVEDYFASAFAEKPANLRSLISKVLDAVNLEVAFEHIVGELSGGQQARLLLAYALIEDPDILLLDEPTNNLDKEGIDHLLTFLIMYDKTVIVISHDADFLNCFTEGVIYLDVFTHQTEMYVGDYYSVVEEISRRVEREIKKNAQLEKKIIDRKEKVNFFAHKGGKMRKLAQKMKEETEELVENMVDVRREDKTIRNFEIPLQEDLSGEIVRLDKVRVIQKHEPVFHEINKGLTRRTRLLATGPNGIGKSTLLRALVAGIQEGISIAPGVKVGYYSQDFSNLDFEKTAYKVLEADLMDGLGEQELRSVAAGFLLTGEVLALPVAALSEGQKGLLAFARLALMKPGLLILDEPTNHINFRHLPVIAEALNKYEGAIIMVSHMPEFVSQVKIDEELDLGKLASK
ncbi:ABC-F family ATP-binding cassette domain-containing protein [Patescibacteria group bacterium]|nr:ABC-F family ATP-binding cassette domain-containing protein [Patescibacteria group bacterium]